MTRRNVLTGIAGAAGLIALVTVLSRVLGFGRWFVHAGTVGPTVTGTAYTTANYLPNILFEVVAGGALAGAVVPLLAGPLARRMSGDVDRIASGLLTWTVLLLTPGSLALAIWSRPLVLALIRPADPAADPELVAATTDLAATLLVVFAPQVVLYGVGVVLTGVLQAQRRFLWPAAAPIASTVVVSVSYLVFRGLAGTAVHDPGALSTTAVAWLGWGTTVGVAAMTLPLLVPVLRSGVRLRPVLVFPAGLGRRAARLAMAGVAGLIAQQAALLVTVALANRHGEPGGTINLFQYAQAVYVLPYAVLAVPLATAAFPRLAEHVASGDRLRSANLVSVSTRAVVVVAGLGAAVLAAAAPAVTQLFAAVDVSGDSQAMEAMTPTLTILAPGLVGYALIFQLSRVLFAMERARAVALAVAAGWGAVLVGSLLAVRELAPDGGDGRGTLVGLASGNSAGMTLAGVVLVVTVRHVAGPRAVQGVARTVVVVGTGAGAGAVVGRWVTDLVTVPMLSGVLGGLCAGLLVAGFVVLLDRSTLRAAARRAGVAGSSDGPATQTGEQE